MGTRFLMMRRQPGAAGDAGALPDGQGPGGDHHQPAIDGMPQRMIRNELLNQLENSGGLKRLLHCVAAVAWRTAATPA